MIPRLVTGVTAYPLSRDSVYMSGRTVFKVIMLFARMFSGGLIPTFLAIRTPGLCDSFWVLVISGTLSVLSTIVVVNCFRGIPEELWEAAMLDGANHFPVLLWVFVPISTPVLATVTLFSAVEHSNAWFDALVYPFLQRYFVHGLTFGAVKE